ncbi:MAG: hypothetical protein ABSB78_14465 [Bacteroidota bacterium]
MNFIQRLLNTILHVKYKRQATKRPPDWNLKISDLVEEVKAGKRKFIGTTEIIWAREYERSLIPDGVRYPQKGDVYESLKDQTVHYLTAWAAPYTGGGDTTLLKGEQFWIKSEPLEKNPIGTYALPIEYKKLEERMVPGSDRDNSKYRGFYFAFTTVELNNNFKLVQTGYTNESEQDASANTGKRCC